MNSKKEITAELIKMLDAYLQARPPSTVPAFNWSRTDWLSIIERMASLLTNKPSNILLDCWLGPTTSHCDSDGYPRLKIDGVLYKLCRLVCVLRWPSLLIEVQGQDTRRAFQASHLCKHDPASCFNPHHLLFQSDADNKKRWRCWNGAAAYCDHHPKCTFTDQAGILIPCRNQTTLPLLCMHEVNCHTVQVGSYVSKEMYNKRKNPNKRTKV